MIQHYCKLIWVCMLWILSFFWVEVICLLLGIFINTLLVIPWYAWWVCYTNKFSQSFRFFHHWYWLQSSIGFLLKFPHEVCFFLIWYVACICGWFSFPLYVALKALSIISNGPHFLISKVFRIPWSCFIVGIFKHCIYLIAETLEYDFRVSDIKIFSTKITFYFITKISIWVNNLIHSKEKIYDAFILSYFKCLILNYKCLKFSTF